MDEVTPLKQLCFTYQELDVMFRHLEAAVDHVLEDTDDYHFLNSALGTISPHVTSGKDDA